jgi:iron complex outermembrane receptor protein
MHFLRKICWVVALWLSSFTLFAQVNGKVIDEQTSKPLDGAHIITDQDTVLTGTGGYFSLHDPTSKIIVSFVGYRADTIITKGDTTPLIIKLHPMARQIEEVVIRVNLNEFSLDRMPSATGYINDLERQNLRSISWVENLNKIPGIYAHTGTLNTNRITIRGIGSRTPYATNRIKAYYNEIPLTTGDGNTEIEDINTSAVGNIELLKGSKSALYGSGLGGVIVLNKPTYTQGFHGFARFSLASFQTIEYEAGIQFQESGFYAGGNYARAQTGGWRENSEYSRDNFTLNTGFANARSQIEFTMLAIRTRAEIPSSLNKETFDNNPEKAAQNWLEVEGYEEYTKLIAGLKFRHSITDRFQNTTNVFVHWYNGYESRPFNILDDNSISWGFRNISSLQLSGLKLQAGIETLFENYSWKIYETLSGKEGKLENQYSEERTPLTIFLNGQYQFENQTIIEAGISLNTLSYKLEDEFADSVNLSGNYRYDWVFSPFLGVNIPAGKRVHLYSSVSHGFSAPSVEETLLPEGSVNPDLKPETGLNAEAGIRYNSENSRLFLDACVYGLWVSNLLVTKRETEDIFYGDNAGKTRHAGMEASAVFRANTNHQWPLTLNLNYTFISVIFTEFTDDGTDFSGNRLPGVPRQNIWFSAFFETPFGLYLLPQFQFTGQQYLNDANDSEYAAYQIINFKAGYRRRFGKFKAEFDVGIGNILDQHYASMILVNAPSFGGSLPRYYYPGMPRNYSLNLKLFF